MLCDVLDDVSPLVHIERTHISSEEINAHIRPVAAVADHRSPESDTLLVKNVRFDCDVISHISR